MNFSRMNECFQTITEEDVLDAMKKIPGYLDITTSDFLKIYRIAFDHAVSRIKTAIPAKQVMTRNVIYIIHPPGGATALIAVIGSEKIHSLGFWYLAAPVGAGVPIMLMVALITNNMAKAREYPEFWF